MCNSIEKKKVDKMNRDNIKHTYNNIVQLTNESDDSNFIRDVLSKLLKLNDEIIWMYESTKHKKG